MNHSYRFLRMRVDVMLGFCLVAFTVALYWSTTSFDFVNLDDISYVIENQIVLNGFTPLAVRDAFVSLYQVMWAPGLWISYMIDVELFGMNPWGFHFTNFLLHTANTLLLYALLCLWTRNPLYALLGAAFWSWHPLRVESVAWVSARKDVLSGFFFLTCILFYYCGTRARINTQTKDAIVSRFRCTSLTCLGLSWLCMAIGLSVKPVLVTVPVVLLLIDVWPLQRLSLTSRLPVRAVFQLALEKWPYWLLAGASSLIALYAHDAGSSLMDMPLLTRLAILPSNYSFYLLKTVDPRNLTILYGSFDFNLIDILIALFFLTVFTYAFWIYRQSHAWALIGWLWFLAVMLPMSGIVRFGVQSLADRFTYLPSIGFSFIILALFFLPNAKARYSGIAIAFAVLGLFATMTYRQIPVWRNSEYLYANLLQHDPSHGFALSDKATRTWRRGQLDEALRLIVQAVESPTHSDTQKIMKAELLAATGQPEAARDYLLNTAYMSPGSSAGLKYFALAMISNQLGDYSAGLTYLENATQTVSVHDSLYRDVYALGVALNYRLNDQQAALEWAAQVPGLRDRTEIRLPDLLPYYLGQWKRLQRREAVDFFRELIAAEPEDIGAKNNLVWLMATAEWSPMPAPEILDIARRTHELQPENPVILDALSAAYGHAGEFDQAVSAAIQVQELLRAGNRGDSDFYRQLHSRIESYQRQEPWRDERVADRLMGRLYQGGS
jgi:protein O-mannosyl-transferase